MLMPTYPKIRSVVNLPSLKLPTTIWDGNVGRVVGLAFSFCKSYVRDSPTYLFPNPIERILSRSYQKCDMIKFAICTNGPDGSRKDYTEVLRPVRKPMQEMMQV